MNVFAFFAGMITSYYLYSKFVAGFFPVSYAMIWVGFTAVSPLLAFICWHAKGESKFSFVLSSMMIAVLFNMTFVYGWIYFEMYSILELAVFICSLLVLRRNAMKDTIMMLVIGILIAIVLRFLVPFTFF